MTTIHAEGHFEVTLDVLPAYEEQEGGIFDQATVNKKLYGDIEGTAVAQMLRTMSPVAGSAAYVALERVTGTLHGKKGTFALVHRATAQGGGRELGIVVVPDSGTGELTGIKGDFVINVVDGKHFWTFDYTLD